MESPTLAQKPDIKTIFESVLETEKEVDREFASNILALKTSSLQLFPTTTAVLLAFEAILLATFGFKFNIYIILSLGCSLFLIIFINSYVRERIDYDAEGLINNKKGFTEFKNKVFKEIVDSEGGVPTEALAALHKRATAGSKPKISFLNPPRNFYGELVNFLQVFSLLNAIIYALVIKDVHICSHYFADANPAVIIVGLFIMSVGIGIYDWALNVNGFLGFVLDKIKPVRTKS